MGGFMGKLVVVFVGLGGCMLMGLMYDCVFG